MEILQERYRFHSRKQQHNESVTEFVQAARRLASTCEFGTEEELIIRDHVLFGLENWLTTMQIIRNGGDPTLSEIIDFCVESGVESSRMPLHQGVFQNEESWRSEIRH